MKVKSFDPIISDSCNILILGTAPGGQSLLRREYYAHGGNNFWPLMQAILDKPGILKYEEKKQMLLNNKIAVWDVLKECDRNTSRDSDIENEIANDFSAFFKSFPSVEKVIFNGQDPKFYFDLHIKLEKSIELLVAKSTSPMNNRRYSFDELLAIWKLLIK